MQQHSSSSTCPRRMGNAAAVVAGKLPLQLRQEEREPVMTETWEEVGDWLDESWVISNFVPASFLLVAAAASPPCPSSSL